MNNLPDLLTASSILLGIITALFGLFYPDIKFVNDIIPKRHAVDNKESYNQSKMVFRTKYLPLLVGSLVITLLNIPELYKFLKSSIVAIIQCGINNIAYDALIATYIVVCLFIMFITAIIIVNGFKIFNKINKLNPNKK